MEKPLLVSGPLVKTAQAGEKTETRRLKGLDIVNELPDEWEFVSMKGTRAEFQKKGQAQTAYTRHPYGEPGDTLWVRENYFFGRGYDEISAKEVPTMAKVWYQADGAKPDWAGRCRPAIHMPRWTCRLKLEVTAVSVERLHAITEDAAKREGVPKVWQDQNGTFWYPASETIRQVGEHGDYRTGFKATWINLNGPDSWASNPWVWVLSFKIKTDNNDSSPKTI